MSYRAYIMLGVMAGIMVSEFWPVLTRGTAMSWLIVTVAVIVEAILVDIWYLSRREKREPSYDYAGPLIEKFRNGYIPGLYSGEDALSIQLKLIDYPLKEEQFVSTSQPNNDPDHTPIGKRWPPTPLAEGLQAEFERERVIRRFREEIRGRYPSGSYPSSWQR